MLVREGSVHGEEEEVVGVQEASQAKQSTVSGSRNLFREQNKLRYQCENWYVFLDNIAQDRSDPKCHTHA